jgi:hypothetical protein
MLPHIHSHCYSARAPPFLSVGSVFFLKTTFGKGVTPMSNSLVRAGDGGRQIARRAADRRTDAAITRITANAEIRDTDMRLQAALGKREMDLIADVDQQRQMYSTSPEADELMLRAFISIVQDIDDARRGR